jgi:putative phage-type endonuclease
MVEQNTPEWHQQRLGKLTASRFSDAVARTKNGWGASRTRYIGELVSERLTGVPYPKFQNSEMQRGLLMEPEARSTYTFFHDADVERIGFIDHPTIAMSGCSPDGLVGSDGLVEIKCPATHTHIATLNGEAIDIAYVAQMHWQMACTGRQWCDFVSYDPRMPVEMRLYVQRIKRDDMLIRMMEKDAQMFLDDVDRAVEQLHKRYPLERAA